MAYKSQNPLKRIIMDSAPLLTLPYEVQLKMKQNRAFMSLKSFASLLKKSNYCPDFLLESMEINRGMPCELDDIVRSPSIFGYRNKLGATIGLDRSRNVVIGHSFKQYRAGEVTHTTVPYLPKEINHETNLRAIKVIEKFIPQSRFLPKARPFEVNTFTQVMVRTNRCDQSMVHVNFNGTLSTEPEIQEEAHAELTEQLLPSLQESINITSLHWQPRGFITNLCDQKYPSEKLWGEDLLQETICGKTFGIGPRAFFQINTEVAELMYENTRKMVKECLKPQKKTILLDLCCGTGTLGIILGDLVDRVIGVDHITSNIDNAKSNTIRNGLSNIEHICMDVEEFIVDLLKSEKMTEYDDVIAVINPSRKGLTTRFCQKLRSLSQLSSLVYLSCHMEGGTTRNLYQLCRNHRSRSQLQPFKMLRAVPLDPFPHTKLIELIMLLSR